MSIFPVFYFIRICDHRDLHILTHSFPTRRSSDLKPAFVAYATSKAALSGMTRAMAVELGSRIRVNAIEPAAIDTPMLRAGFEGSSEGYERLRNFHPAKVIGNAYDLGSLARAIIEVPSVFLNGAVIGFDGGIGARSEEQTSELQSLMR